MPAINLIRSRKLPAIELKQNKENVSSNTHRESTEESNEINSSYNIGPMEENLQAAPETQYIRISFSSFVRYGNTKFAIDYFETENLNIKYTFITQLIPDYIEHLKKISQFKSLLCADGISAEELSKQTKIPIHQIKILEYNKKEQIDSVFVKAVSASNNEMSFFLFGTDKNNIILHAGNSIEEGVELN